MVRHELGTGGAVQPDGQQVGVSDGGEQRFGVLAGEHGAHGFDGAGNHDGDFDAGFVRKALDAEQGGFDVARVLAVSTRKMSTPPSARAFA